MTNLLSGLQNIQGIIHIGAHHGQERDYYLTLGAKHIVWVEPIPEAFHILSMNSTSLEQCFNCALGDSSGRATLFVASNEGQSSSLLAPKYHLDVHPEVSFPDKIEVDVKRLEDLEVDFSQFNVLILDVQGAELKVLKGAFSILKNFKYIVAEIQVTELYSGGVIFDDLTFWLESNGFRHVKTEWSNPVWGNALYSSNIDISEANVHAFVFNWLNMASSTRRLVDLIGPVVDDITVISSGYKDCDSNWVIIDERAHFGQQWNEALNHFNGGILFHQQADSMLVGRRYADLLRSCRSAFHFDKCGVYAPRIDHSAWDSSHRSSVELSSGLFSVDNTDCTCWMIHEDILRMQPKSFNSIYGWGIDKLYCSQSMELNRPVLRDYRYLVNHDQGSNYSGENANFEMNHFVASYNVRKRSEPPLW